MVECWAIEEIRHAGVASRHPNKIRIRVKAPEYWGFGRIGGLSRRCEPAEMRAAAWRWRDVGIDVRLVWRQSRRGTKSGVGATSG